MHPLSVINPPYFAPYPIDLTFTVNAPGFNADQVVAFDVCGRAIFMSKPSKSSGKKFLVDAISGRPLFTLKSKVNFPSISPVVIAMTEEHRIPVGGNTFGVKIHPGGIDVAFIAAFIVILHE
ncbi:uncharacterized protein A4U43_C05F4400, partial [Asparagus officinalis]